MSDHFRQTAWISLSSPETERWRLAADVRDMLEAAYGANWKNVRIEYTASTRSGITFRDVDLPSLHRQTDSHGGPLRDISIETSLRNDGAFCMANANVWTSDSSPLRISITWFMPKLVDAESFRYSLEKSTAALGRRKRWKNAHFEAQQVHHETEASAQTAQTTARLIPAKGLRQGARSWFIRNRDSIIVSLATGLAGAITIIGLQIGGVIPTP